MSPRWTHLPMIVIVQLPMQPQPALTNIKPEILEECLAFVAADVFEQMQWDDGVIFILANLISRAAESGKLAQSWTERLGVVYHRIVTRLSAIPEEYWSRNRGRSVGDFILPGIGIISCAQAADMLSVIGAAEAVKASMLNLLSKPTSGQSSWRITCKMASDSLHHVLVLASNLAVLLSGLSLRPDRNAQHLQLLIDELLDEELSLHMISANPSNEDVVRFVSHARDLDPHWWKRISQQLLVQSSTSGGFRHEDEVRRTSLELVRQVEDMPHCVVCFFDIRPSPLSGSLSTPPANHHTPVWIRPVSSNGHFDNVATQRSPSVFGHLASAPSHGSDAISITVMPVPST
ncbi:hypothetical protein BKA62DRAFT_774030 [Auriculariales sp. MPI-PUGE-AT-0066]|nr:hypothetical protein BKA62DRAFT_774030 [Auriculariales sp. MPI-PUGE-AT-0066]